jgi:hypothetical protein
MNNIIFPKELGQKWINALKSKEYNQGFGCLKMGDDYCAMGVLGDLLNVKVDSECVLSPLIPIDHEIQMYLNAPINNTTFELEVSRLNDKNFNFEGIAQWLEENLELV